MKLKIGGKVQIGILVIFIMLLLVTGCKKTEINDSVKYENSGFAVGIDEYLYYIKYSPAQGDLYKYDMLTGKEYFVDNIFNRTNNFFGNDKNV